MKAHIYSPGALKMPSDMTVKGENGLYAGSDDAERTATAVNLAPTVGMLTSANRYTLGSQ